MRKTLIIFLVLVILVSGFLFKRYLNNNHETPILMYHSLDRERVNNYAAVAPETFLKQMEFIAKGNYRVISLKDYCQQLKEGKTIARNSIVITFDDGYKDNLLAFEILKQFEYPAIFFIIVSKINSPGYLSKSDIDSALKNPKIRIGSHTLNEAYLPSLDHLGLKREIINSKIALESIFNQRVETISYTIGGFNKQTLREVEAAGYLCACTTNRGFSKKLSPYALRRIKITNRDLGIRLWAKLSGFYNVFRKPKKPY